MVGKTKRPQGRPPIGAVWLEDEGRYEYTQAYYDNREQSFILKSNKIKRTKSTTRSIIKRRSSAFVEI